MIVFYSLAIAMSITAQTDLKQERWITLLLKSEPARQVLLAESRESKPPSYPSIEVKVDGQTSYLVSGPGGGPSAQEVLYRVDSLIKDGRDTEALDYVSKERGQYIGSHDVMLDLTAKCELLCGYNAEAFRDAVIRVNGGGFGGEEQKLYLSLASASLGRVYPGQAKFCEKWIQEHLRNQGSAQLVAPSRRGLDPHEVMVLSCLALGTKNAPEFLEMTLRLDPVNDLAAKQAMYFYECKGKYSDMRRVASSIAAHLPAGAEKSFYLKEVARVAKLKDKPQHPVINP